MRHDEPLADRVGSLLVGVLVGNRLPTPWERRRHGAARLAAHERLLGQPAQRMIGPDDALERSTGGCGRQQRAHRRVRKEHLAARADDGHGVFQMLDGRFQVRHLPGHLRPIGGQLRADRVEEVSQITELVVLIEIETDAELTLTEPRQAASNDVNRPEQQLRQQARHKHRDRQRREGGGSGGSERRVEVLPDQQRRNADAERRELGVAEQQRLLELQIAPLARVDGHQLRQRRTRKEPAQVAARRQRLTVESGIGVRDDEVVHVDDRRKRHVLGVETRGENRPQTGIGAQRLVRIGAFANHFPRPLIDGARDKVCPGLAFFEAHSSEPRKVQQAQHHDDRADERRNAENLLPFDA